MGVFQRRIEVSDQGQPPSTSIASQIAVLFSPATFAAIRYALTTVGALLAMFGLTALSSDKIDSIINMMKQLGTTIGAILTLIGIITPVAMAVIGTVRSTVKSQIASVRAIAKEQQPLTKDAKNALVAATISLDEVQTIVGTKEIANASPSASVVSTEDVTVVHK
jgi:hypothetical protein